MKDFSDLARAEIREQALCLRAALAEWPPIGGDGHARAQEIALDIVASAGMLHRYTGQLAPLEHLTEWPPEARRDLALAAAGAFDTQSLVARLKELAREDSPEEGDIASVEQALLQRDLLEVAMDTLNHLCADMLPDGEVPDPDVGDALGQAWQQLDALDKAFEEASAITSIAMPIFDGLKQLIQVEDARHRWWLEDGLARVAREETVFINSFFQGRRVKLSPTEDTLVHLLDKLGLRATSPAWARPAAAGGASVECMLRGSADTIYFEIACTDDSSFVCRVYGVSGVALHQAADWDLVMTGEQGDLAVWPFDNLGATRVNAFPAGQARRLLVRHRQNSETIGEVALDD